MRNKLLLAAMGLSAASSAEVGGSAGSGAKTSQEPQAQAAPTATAPDLEALLKAVAEKPEPKDLRMGALCYAPAIPAARTEYVCPACGAKTLHATQRVGWNAPVLSIGAYREHVHKLKQLGLGITLDESCLCSACKKEGVSTLAVVVAYKGKSTRSDLKGVDDLRKLLAFVEGKLVWKTSNGGESPLKPELPRIRELLGLEPTP